MKKVSVVSFFALMTGFLFFTNGCKQSAGKDTPPPDNPSDVVATNYGGFKSEVDWGKHLITIGGCHDCHTPKKFGSNGIEPDMDLELSGHPANLALPAVDRKQIEEQGYSLNSPTVTGFIGPWGISYAANLSSDSITGIGNWTLEQFINTFRLGKFGGAPKGRDLLPPMPWQNINQMSDGELKAVFAYLKSTKPVHNVVPQPVPPVSAQ